MKGRTGVTRTGTSPGALGKGHRDVRDLVL